jgi:hypothetical protein
MLRSPRTRPFAVGDKIEVTGMQAEIISVTYDNRPRQVAFSFDPEQHLFYALDAAGYRPFELPPLGTCVELATPSFLEFVLGADNALARVLKPKASEALCQVAASAR